MLKYVLSMYVRKRIANKGMGFVYSGFVLFDDISTIVDYLMPHLLYIYIKYKTYLYISNIYDL